MSDIKMVNWPKRPAEVRRDELEAENAELKSANEALKVFISGQESENAELRKLIEQMRDALRLALPEARSTHVEQTILAALAAERGRRG